MAHTGDEADDVFFDSNDCLAERRWIAGQEVIVHYDDVPDSDKTIVRGIPCTTALRTVIDIAVDVTQEHLDEIVADCFRRRLFTPAEAWERLAQPDMQKRRGAELLRHALLR